MAQGKKGKGAKTKVRTRVTTGTAVALLFLSASAAFAAAAFTKPAVSIRPLTLKTVALAELSFKDGRAALYTKGTEPGANPSLQLSAMYYNNGTGDTGEHGIGYDFKKSDRTTVIGSMLTLNNRGTGPYLNLEPMGSRQIEESVPNVPLDAAFITLYLDYDNRVKEGNENDNQITLPIGRSNALVPTVPVAPAAPPPTSPTPTTSRYDVYGTLPDLVPEQFSLTSQTVSSPRIGTQMVFNALIANRGMATARDTFYVELQAKTPGWGQDWVRINSFHYSALAPEQTISYTVPVFLSEEILPEVAVDRTANRSAKRYSDMTDFRFVVDSSNTINESTETNNQSVVRNQFMR